MNFLPIVFGYEWYVPSFEENVNFVDIFLGEFELLLLLPWKNLIFGSNDKSYSKIKQWKHEL